MCYKGYRKPSNIKKLDKVRMGLPVECQTHGMHLRWRIHSGNNVKCKMCATEEARRNNQRDPIRKIWRTAKRHSRDINREFSITIEDLDVLLLKQEGKCALSGEYFTFENMPSLDRIDSSLGYSKENIQLVLVQVNVMKSNFK
jgi:hypothetical protein